MHHKLYELRELNPSYLFAKTQNKFSQTKIINGKINKSFVTKPKLRLIQNVLYHLYCERTEINCVPYIILELQIY